MNDAQLSSPERYQRAGGYHGSVNPTDVFGPPHELFTTDDPFLKSLLAQESAEIKQGLPKTEHRPPIPYSVLICEALKSKPARLMTLQEIYDWFEQFHPFYCENNHNWRNSVRHTLSSNRMFKRIPRYNNASGRGSMWALADEVSEKQESRLHKRRKSMNDMPQLMEFYASEGARQKMMEGMKEIMKGFKPNPELSMSQTTANTSEATQSAMFQSLPETPKLPEDEVPNIDLSDFMVEFK